MKTGVLLINLGTPDAPETRPVRRYLREFLSDPRVVDINPVGRWLLLNLFILPGRPAKSAAAYRKIWDPVRGSPLLYLSQDLAAGVQAQLGPEVPVVLAMRYGNPSLAAGLSKLREAGADRIIAAPLYPQYASSSTGSSIELLYRLAGERWNTPHVDVLPPFYDDASFIAAFVDNGRAARDAFAPDHVVFSFHGLPERQIRKSDESGTHCLASPDCCARMTEANRNCYRAQCFRTAEAIAAGLGLAADATSITFQSRLGKTPWIKPYTDVVLPELARAGKKRVLVFCPAFVADCLETLEEIGMRAHEQWKSVGGDDLMLVPSLNASPAWVDAVTAMIRARL